MIMPKGYKCIYRVNTNTNTNPNPTRNHQKILNLEKKQTTNKYLLLKIVS